MSNTPSTPSMQYTSTAKYSWCTIWKGKATQVDPSTLQCPWPCGNWLCSLLIKRVNGQIMNIYWILIVSKQLYLSLLIWPNLILKVESCYVEIFFIFNSSEANYFAKVYLSWEWRSLHVKWEWFVFQSQAMLTQNNEICIICIQWEAPCPLQAAAHSFRVLHFL